MDVSKLIEEFGSASEFARAMGVSRQAVHNWMEGKSRMSRIHMEKVVSIMPELHPCRLFGKAFERRCRHLCKKGKSSGKAK